MKTRRSRRNFGRAELNYDAEWSFSEIMRFVPDETDRYRYFVWYFDTQLPQHVRDHRLYFARKNRGFGEDAFHAMWWKLFMELHPIRALELGVYRGQILSLWELMSRELGLPVEAWGVSPLINLGDTVSQYLDIADYQLDVDSHFRKFGLGEAKLFRGKSQDATSVAFIKSQKWDLIYIDGSHDFEEVVQDLELSKGCLERGGYLVLDDASLFSSYVPPSFSFKGHSGPSSVVMNSQLMEGLTEIATCGHNRVYVKD
jgi:hypothetical protein